MTRRRFPSRSRKSNQRDPKLIVIATEGEKTEKLYFEQIRDKYKNSQVKIEILSTEEGKSAPKHVLQRLKDSKSKYSLRKHDELWLVIDRDRWANFDKTINESLNEGFYLAISNPRFEIWLLLHFEDIASFSKAQKKQIVKNLDQKLRLHVTGYKKTNFTEQDFMPYVEDAIKNAKKLDIDENLHYPKLLGTRVYKLVLSIRPKSTTT